MINAKSISAGRVLSRLAVLFLAFDAAIKVLRAPVAPWPRDARARARLEPLSGHLASRSTNQ